MYLNTSLVDIAFKRLSFRETGGKAPKEKTSALMYFLAFDATIKNIGSGPADFSPRSGTGKRNREKMAIEFVRLVQLKNASNGKVRQISVLGQIEEGNYAPEKRISSNFFTVPLKNASESSTPQNYPNRPAPVFKMGGPATQLDWGIDYHNDWKKNLPKFLSAVKSNTPFTDLAILVLRNTELATAPESLRDTLAEKIRLRFTSELSTFWIKQMEAEKVFVRHINNPYQEGPPNPLPGNGSKETIKGSTPDILRSLDKEMLIDRVIYLEGLLDAQEIDYQTILTN